MYVSGKQSSKEFTLSTVIIFHRHYKIIFKLENNGECNNSIRQFYGKKEPGESKIYSLLLY